MVALPSGLNLGIHKVSVVPIQGGDLVQQMERIRQLVMSINMKEMLSSAYG